MNILIATILFLLALVVDTIVFYFKSFISYACDNYVWYKYFILIVGMQVITYLMVIYFYAPNN